MATDSYFSNVKIQLPFSGADGGILFSDLTGRGWTRSGAVTSFTQKKFGPSSGFFNSASYLQANASEDFFFGTGAFTIECWVYISANSGADGSGLKNAQLYTNMSASNGGFGFQIIGTGSTTGTGLGWEDNYGGSNISGSWTTTVSQSTWHHVCVGREDGSSNLLIGLDGTLQTSAISGGSSRSLGSNAYQAQIGGQPQVASWNRYLNGYIDDFRLTKGVCRYTGSSYTVPTEAFQGWVANPARIGGYLKSPRMASAGRSPNPFVLQAGRLGRNAAMPGGGMAELGFISGTITESTPFSRWRFFVSDAVTGERLGVREGAGASYSILIPKNRPAMVTCAPLIDGRWAARKMAVAGELWVPAAATTTPYVFRCTTAGITGASEPSWDTAVGNTTSDGSAVWTCFSRLMRPVTHGPLLAA